MSSTEKKSILKSKISVASMLFITSLIVSTIGSCNVSSPQTQSNSEPKTCEEAIASVKNQLETDRQLTVEISQAMDISTLYTKLQLYSNKKVYE